MTYEELCSFETLYQSYLIVRKGKRHKKDCIKYETRLIENLQQLSSELLCEIYKPGKFHIFYVYEPKKRMVQAPTFADKIVLNAIITNVLYQTITRSFIRDNYASQINKGTLDGLMRLKQHMQQYYKKNKTSDGWVLKGDIRHFFANINHNIVKEKLLKLFIKNNIDIRIFTLLCKYIDNSKGLPLGYATSQLLALLFLNEFDHLAISQYNAEGQGRQMDDFYMIFNKKQDAKLTLNKIEKYMKELKLELNQKTAIFPLKNGIDFIGFHTYLMDNGKVIQKLRRANIQKIRRTIKQWDKSYQENKINKKQIIDKFRAWDAHAAYGNTYNLRLKYAKKVSVIINENIKPRRRITANQIVKNKRRVKQMVNYYNKHREPPIIRYYCYEEEK